MKRKKYRGQSLGEYAVLFAIVVAAFVGMQVFIKRGVQGGIKICSDQIGNQQDYANVTDPIKGGLDSAVSIDNTQGRTTISTAAGGAESHTISQTSSKGAGSYSQYNITWVEGEFYGGQ